MIRSRALLRILIAVLAISLLAPVRTGLGQTPSEERPTNKGVDLMFRVGVEELALATSDAEQDNSPSAEGSTSAEGDELGNVQVNDPALDHIQTFAGTRPFEFSIQSETSIVAFRNDIVVGYNSSADQPIIAFNPATNVATFQHRHLSGFSASHNGGRTWTSGFVPPAPGSRLTFGDPSLAVDRRGNFFYASLGTDAAGTFGLIVNKSTDGGHTFAPAVVAALDNGADKEWLAAGPDPFRRDRDNLYLAWTSFQPGRSELRFVRSLDGGQTWSAQRVLFAPVDTGVLSAFIQFANPVVDASSGRLYIPFLHFSNIDEDFIRVLVSDDGGVTFRSLRFNVAGAPDPFGFPNVTPGVVTDCGSPGGGIRQVLHQGPNLGGGRGGLPRFRQATRLITQPSAAAANGKIFIALNSSTSPVFGDPFADSEIRLLFSLNGGENWRAVTVVPATAADPQHVHPAIIANKDAGDVQIAYYVQQADTRLRVDSVRVRVSERRVHAEEVQPLSSVAFNLIPSNNPIPTPTLPFQTTNYDRTIRACYNIGEYLSLFPAGDGAIAAWGDNRNTWTSPAGSPAAGTHAQPDVFFQGAEE